MQLISDIILALAALVAAGYCFVLARRLKQFNQLESGMGGAIAVLSAQVDDMTRALQKAQATAAHSETELRALTERAEAGAEKLEILLASLHDLPSEPEPAPVATPEVTPEPEPRRRVLRRRLRDIDLEAAE
ncbi:hypothetical protein DL1_02525 [Thioclava dalianensis]|uniref:Uncharacterized protein n=1 Tax=Thioclava dalianensis TaxID=1185766 RepID=A0A074THT1_9RHOB|nr:DUF6468 domain-containing protein [Thioclava dalianensis]KEP69710.1 hypothetical protein DL1_02525 [Thioclava dalianensis]SFM93271.1 hypothetical protein SAMN05216224_1011000 [Thioclava dalianensis]